MQIVSLGDNLHEMSKPIFALQGSDVDNFWLVISGSIVVLELYAVNIIIITYASFCAQRSCQAENGSMSINKKQRPIFGIHSICPVCSDRQT